MELSAPGEAELGIDRDLDVDLARSLLVILIFWVI